MVSERQLEVVRFGQREPAHFRDEEVLTFPRGLVGMEGLRRFALLEDERIAPCHWLQSLDQPDLVFTVVEPQLVVPEYNAEVPDEDAQQVELESASGARLWAIVTIDGDPARSTINLLAPVVINTQRRLGKQVILEGSGYAVRHPLSDGVGTAADTRADPES